MSTGTAKQRIQRLLYSLLYQFEYALYNKSEESLSRSVVRPDLSGLRICLVKQDVYADLYCCRYGSSPGEAVLSSIKRSGPVALLSQWGADFRIIKTEEGDGCDVWKQKWTDGRQRPLEYYYALQKNANIHGQTTLGGQSEHAISASEVDWSAYDLVISLDISIPTRIVKKYPDTVWAYWISEPCMREYKYSLARVYPGYNLFLNQRFWDRLIPTFSQHEIDFPYCFQSTGCYSGILDEPSDKRGVIVESHTKDELGVVERSALAAFGPVRQIEGSIHDVLSGLLHSRYWVRLGGRPLWGNGMIEALACGCIGLANPSFFKNRALFTQGSTVDDFKSLINRLEVLEEDQNLRQRIAHVQAMLLNEYAYYRPMASLRLAYDTVRAKVI